VTKADAAFKLSIVELEGVDELSARVFRAFLRALRLHRQLMIATLADHDSHPGQAICLRFLSANDGITQRELADALQLARPTVTKMLQSMEKAGAIERRHDETDQRLTRVHLTATGRQLEVELRTVSAALIGDTIGELNEVDRRELERLLDALSGNISAAITARHDERAARTAADDEPAAGGSRARDAKRPSA
jgi:MarR family transcriptional regulator, organic hydroperoxide resistance regulator